MYYWLKRSCFNLYLKGGEENLTISTGSIHAHPKASRFLGLWLIRSLINIFLWLVMSLGSKVDHWTQQEIWSISLNFQKCHCATAMPTAENARTTNEVEDNAVQMAWRLQEGPPTHWTTQSKWKVFDRSMVGGWSPAYVCSCHHKANGWWSGYSYKQRREEQLAGKNWDIYSRYLIEASNVMCRTNWYKMMHEMESRGEHKNGELS